jgi:hypothetical protein
MTRAVVVGHALTAPVEATLSAAISGIDTLLRPVSARRGATCRVVRPAGNEFNGDLGEDRARHVIVLLFATVFLCIAIAPHFLDRLYYSDPVSSHFDGQRLFNPDGDQDRSRVPGGRRAGFFARWLTGSDGRPARPGMWPSAAPPRHGSRMAAPLGADIPTPRFEANRCPNDAHPEWMGLGVARAGDMQRAPGE